jgi:hypothetical protein
MMDKGVGEICEYLGAIDYAISSGFAQLQTRVMFLTLAIHSLSATLMVMSDDETLQDEGRKLIEELRQARALDTLKTEGKPN